MKRNFAVKMNRQERLEKELKLDRIIRGVVLALIALGIPWGAYVMWIGFYLYGSAVFASVLCYMAGLRVLNKIMRSERQELDEAERSETDVQ